MKTVRCLVGAYSGQAIEYPDWIAESLLARGLATEVDADPVSQATEQETPVVDPAVIPYTKNRRSRSA